MSKPFTPRPYQGLIIDHILAHKRCAIWAGMGLGKQQPDSEPVLTPAGWMPMGSLRVGDHVIGSDGKPTQVLGVFPQGEHESLRITFTDGSFCHAGWEHLWYVQSPQQKSQGKVGYVLTTRQLVNSGLRRKMGNREEAYWHVPMVQPVEFSEKALSVDPYTLGAILGDGTLTNGSVSICTDLEILEAIGARVLRPHETCEYVAYGSLPGLASAMRSLGFADQRSQDKFVPPEYLLGSPAQRLALLQGLLDTDAYAMPDGGVEFSTTSGALADAVIELAQSLGGQARDGGWHDTQHQNGPGQAARRINVKMPSNLPPFRLKRKLDRWVPPTKYLCARKIASVEVVGREHATCIKVAAHDSLYVTRNYIVTHNTSSSLTAIDAMLLAGHTPILVIAPLRVAKQTWPQEVHKWLHTEGIRYQTIVGNVRERTAALQDRKAEVFFINYECLPWLVEYWGEHWPYKVVFADESTKLKGFRLRQGGKRARSLATVAFAKVERFIELTGTPSPNGLIDLWGQMWFIDRGQRLGKTFQAFKDRWFRPHPSGFGVEALPHAQAEIQDRLKDICLTIEAKDWFDLREPIVNNVYVDLPARARKAYEEMEKQMFTQLDSGDELEAFNAASRTIKCLQMASGAAYTGEGNTAWQEIHDEKLQALDEIIEEAAGMPVLVAYHFKSDLARLKKAFPQGRELDKNPATQDAWNRGEIPVLFAHPASAGHGLNLQDGGNTMVFFSMWWNLEERLQIVERIGPTRQLQAGYDRPVFIHNILARKTVDEMVLERVETKREVQDILMSAMRRKRV